MNSPLFRIGVLSVKNERVSDHPNPHGIRPGCKLCGKPFLMFFSFWAYESDFDQFMAQKPVIDRLDHSRHKPFFPNLDDWFAVVRYASEI